MRFYDRRTEKRARIAVIAIIVALGVTLASIARAVWLTCFG